MIHLFSSFYLCMWSYWYDKKDACKLIDRVNMHNMLANNIVAVYGMIIRI